MLVKNDDCKNKYLDRILTLILIFTTLMISIYHTSKKQTHLLVEASTKVVNKSSLYITPNYHLLFVVQYGYAWEYCCFKLTAETGNSFLDLQFALKRQFHTKFYNYYQWYILFGKR